MNVAIRVLKILLLLCALGWAYLNLRWILFISDAFKFLQSVNGATEIHQATAADFWPNVQVSVVMFAPLVLALILLFITWPESMLVNKNGVKK